MVSKTLACSNMQKRLKEVFNKVSIAGAQTGGAIDQIFHPTTGEIEQLRLLANNLEERVQSLEARPFD
jgi:hypothetical protein